VKTVKLLTFSLDIIMKITELITYIKTNKKCIASFFAIVC